MPQFDASLLRTEFSGRQRSCELTACAGGDVYHDHVVSDRFCELIMESVKRFEIANADSMPDTANSMHHDAILIDHLGLESFVRSFAEHFVDQLAPNALPTYMVETIENVHSYVVRYGRSLDVDLDFHVDDSFLTLNLCLNDGFSGSELLFNGARCPIHVDTPFEDDELTTIQHKKGHMVVHAGKNRHYVRPITSGDRYNLIIWCQNAGEHERWFDALREHHCLDFCRYYAPRGCD